MKVTIDKDFADEHIRSCVENFDPTLTTDQANVSMIREKIFAAIEAGRAPLFRFDKPEHILPAVKAANLPLKADIEYALRAAWDQSSYIRCAAYDEMILDEAVSGGYSDLESSQLYLGIIERLGQQHNWAVNQRGAAQQATTNQQVKRDRLIKNILGA